MSDCQSCVNFVAHDDVASQRRIYGSKTGVSSCVATGASARYPSYGFDGHRDPARHSSKRMRHVSYACI